MRKHFILIITFFLILSCKNQTEEKKTDRKPADESELDKSEEKQDSLKEYSSEKMHFALQFPAEYKVKEGELPGKAPVVNVYDPQNEKDPPYAIHEKAKASYIAFLPNGFGVDGPSGKRKSFREWENSLPLSFEIDTGNSTVYLLENGQPWAASIRFYNPPPGWKDHGSIFMHYAVEDFKAECFNEVSGAKKAMKDCDPLRGDKVKYFGEVSAESKEALNTVLQSINFFSENNQRQKISDLIKVDHPLPNEKIESPLKITGNARGFWYFEGQAPFKLVDKDYKTLARGSLQAQGEWTTEEFVPYEANVSFETPGNESGYLVFNRSNPSGKPENDRVYRIPVIFPPKNNN